MQNTSMTTKLVSGTADKVQIIKRANLIFEQTRSDAGYEIVRID